MCNLILESTLLLVNWKLRISNPDYVHIPGLHKYDEYRAGNKSKTQCRRDFVFRTTCQAIIDEITEELIVESVNEALTIYIGNLPVPSWPFTCLPYDLIIILQHLGYSPVRIKVLKKFDTEFRDAINIFGFVTCPTTAEYSKLLHSTVYFARHLLKFGPSRVRKWTRNANKGFHIINATEHLPQILNLQVNLLQQVIKSRKSQVIHQWRTQFDRAFYNPGTAFDTNAKRHLNH